MRQADEDALRARISELSDRQRAALAAALLEDHRKSGPQRLVAYLVSEGAPPTAQELDEHLEERIPSYMVPSRYIALERLPRTPAGKLDRRGVAALGGTDVPPSSHGVVAPRNDRERALAEIWGNVLGVEELSVHDDFFEIGGDSLLSIRVIARAGKAGIPISPEAFFTNATIAGLAALGESATAPAEQGIVSGLAPLTPIQEWFFERITDSQSHWNQAFLLRPPEELDAESLRAIVGELVAHHDGLRLGLRREGDGWRQHFSALYGSPDVRVVDLSDVPESERSARMQVEADEEHRSLDLAMGHLFRVVLFEDGVRFRRVLLVAHHLVVDAVSWGFILEDLSTLAQQTLSGSPLRLPPKTVSALDWAHALCELAEQPEVTETAAFWASSTVDEGPEVRGSTSNLMRDAATESLQLTPTETTELLEVVAKRMGVSPEAILLGGFLSAWRRWSGVSRLQLDLEGHGRAAVGHLDASRTVGWFTTVFPLDVQCAEEPEETVRAVSTALSGLPGGRWAHGVLRYLHPDPEVRRSLAARPRSRVLFNYLGSTDGLLGAESGFSWGSEPSGRARGEQAPRAYEVEINGLIRDGAATLVVEYSTKQHGAEEIQSLVEAAGLALRSMLGPSGRDTAFGLDGDALSRVADLLSAADGE